MKPLHVCLIHRDNDNYRNLTGWWSYAVPEFTWEAVKVPPLNFQVTVPPGEYDLAVLDDWIFGRVEHKGTPLVYVTVDSARSPEQLARNQRQAREANLVLCDSDDPLKFGGKGRRWAYAVNEKLYHPRRKTHDVSFLCWPTPPRREVQQWAREICYKRGWSFLTGTFANFQDYAAAIGSARVVVHKAHVEGARSWRVFDVMASKGALLSSPLPIVSGDGICPGEHYSEYHGRYELEQELARLLDGGAWAEQAERGYQHVLDRHTWAIRARELRELVEREFKL